MITLSVKELPAFMHGVCRIKKEGELNVYYRMTEEQLAAFRGHDVFSVRSNHTGGIWLECNTDARSVSFDYALDNIVTTGCTDVWADDMPVYVHIFGTDTAGTLSCALPEGRKRLRLYFPNYCAMKTGDILLDGTYAKPVRHKTKVLWYGDSITQGAGVQDAGSMMAGGSYMNLTTRILGWDSLNHAIGGLSYDSRVIVRPQGYMPDKIVVSLGTNGGALPEYIRCAEDFYARLAQVYPGVPVLAVTPIWRGTGYEKLPARTAAVREILAAYPNITPVDGDALVPHLLCMFAKDQVHPFLIGHKYYAENLIRAIRRSGF